MHHAPNLGHAAFVLEKSIVNGVGVRLQISLISFQKFRRTGARSRGRVVVHDHRMVRISHIRPDPSDSGKGKFPVQHLHTGVIGADHLRTQQLFLHQLMVILLQLVVEQLECHHCQVHQQIVIVILVEMEFLLEQLVFMQLVD